MRTSSTRKSEELTTNEVKDNRRKAVATMACWTLTIVDFEACPVE